MQERKRKIKEERERVKSLKRQVEMRFRAQVEGLAHNGSRDSFMTRREAGYMGISIGRFIEIKEENKVSLI